jgi:hypothetical protein
VGTSILEEHSATIVGVDALKTGAVHFSEM